MDRRIKYEDKRAFKKIGFNLETEQDLLAAANTLPNFSQFVKDHLRSVLNHQKSKDIPLEK